MKYLCAVRGKGRKWEAVAWTDQGGCIAGAEDVFRCRGYTGDVFWADTLQAQKNFGGFAPGCPEVKATPCEIRLHFARSLCAGRRAEDEARLCDTFPDHAREIRMLLRQPQNAVPYND